MGPVGPARTGLRFRSAHRLVARPSSAPYGLVAGEVVPTATNPHSSCHFLPGKPRNGPSPATPPGGCRPYSTFDPPDATRANDVHPAHLHGLAWDAPLRRRFIDLRNPNQAAWRSSCHIDVFIPAACATGAQRKRVWAARMVALVSERCFPTHGTELGVRTVAAARRCSASCASRWPLPRARQDA
jgi:hypothetical protein